MSEYSLYYHNENCWFVNNHRSDVPDKGKDCKLRYSFHSIAKLAGGIRVELPPTRPGFVTRQDLNAVHFYILPIASPSHDPNSFKLAAT